MAQPAQPQPTVLEKVDPEVEAHINPLFKVDRILSVFGRYLEMARTIPGIVNLGQGFPDFAIPEFLQPALSEEMMKNSSNQYCRPAGPIPLVEELALTYGPRFGGRKIDPLKEIFVGNGATGCFNTFLQSYAQPGDELVTFEPCFVYYIPPMDNFKLVAKYVSLLKEGPSLNFDRKEFEAAFSSKTKMLMINSPHNPTGKVFNIEEITYICDFLKKNYPHVVVLCDDVYSDITFGENKMNYICALPDMWKRTITMCSFGKTFSCTGWRLGFTFGPAELIGAMQAVQTLSIYCITTPIALAAEKVLKIARTQPYKGEENYYAWLKKAYEQKKEAIVEAFKASDLNIELWPTQGGYFFSGKIDKAIEGIPIKYFYKDYATNDHGGAKLDKLESWKGLSQVDFSPDYAYANYLAAEKHIVTFPFSGFFDTMLKPPHEKKCVNFIRISLCKSDESIIRLREVLGVAQADHKHK